MPAYRSAIGATSLSATSSGPNGYCPHHRGGCSTTAASAPNSAVTAPERAATPAAEPSSSTAIVPVAEKDDSSPPRRGNGAPVPAPLGRSTSTAAGPTGLASNRATRSCASSGLRTGRTTQDRADGSGCSSNVAEE